MNVESSTPLFLEPSMLFLLEVHSGVLYSEAYKPSRCQVK